MTPTERRALRIARDALDLETVRRPDFLDEQCGDDAALRLRVQALLQCIEQMETAPSLPETEDPGVAAATDALIGARLGPFRVVERIGRGGTGIVYRGEREDDGFDQTVAIKLIRRGFDFDEVRARFLRERRILAQMNHPHLARLVDGGVADDGRPWFALEHVRGESITRWCDRRRLDLRSRVCLFLDVCAAVQYAHTQLVVHRDLKPGNILVDDNGAVRLLDFGIAQLLFDPAGEKTTLTTLAGPRGLTPEYAAPEQFTGNSTGVASDIYSLGVVAYELIAGVLPREIARNDFNAPPSPTTQPIPSLTQAIARAIQPGTTLSGRSERPTSAQYHKAARDTEPPLERRLAARSVSLRGYRSLARGDLSRILATALADEPERRYATVAAFADDLQRWLDGAPVRASGNRFGYRAGKFLHRNRWAVAVAGALAAGLVATSIIALHQAQAERTQREAAMAELERSNAVREYVMLMFRTAAEQTQPERITAHDVLKQSADQLLDRFHDSPDTGPTTALMLAELFMMLGDAEGAAPLLERLTDPNARPMEPDVLASAQYNFAQIQYYRGRANDSATLLAAAQRYWRTPPGRHAARLNESRMLQSQLERAAGHLDAALATLREAVEERRDRLQIRDRELAVMLATESSALVHAGQYTAAYDRADEACRLLDELGLARSTVGLGAINNRAQALMMLRRFDEAHRDFRTVVDTHRKLYGESLQLATAQNNLALSLVRQARHADAIPLLEQALAMATKHSGEHGRATMMPRINLAEAYATVGRVNDAAPLAETAVSVGIAQFGADNLFTGLGHRARARVRIALGDRTGAKADLTRAAAIFTAMGAGGMAYLDSLENLSNELSPGLRPER